MTSYTTFLTGNVPINDLTIVGTRSFMANNKDIVKDCTELEEVTCDKDTIGKRRLQKWSRGIFIIATAGGHIEYWQPLYK